MSHSANERAAREAAVGQYLGPLRELMQNIPADQRPTMMRFWSTVREDLCQKDTRITELQRELGPYAPPDRPPSSASMVALREAMDRAVETEANQVSASDAHQIATLPQAFAMGLLGGPSTNRGGTLGCWTIDNAPSHKGYQKINLRNTRHPTTRALIGAQVYRHQLAVVAAGRGNKCANFPRSRFLTYAIIKDASTRTTSLWRGENLTWRGTAAKTSLLWLCQTARS